MTNTPFPSSRPDSTTLYNHCRSPNPATQRAAYESLWRILYPIARNLFHNQADADDLAQDCAQQALIRIHQRLHECNSPAAFLSWAQRIVTNLALDELRGRKRFVSHSVQNGDAEFERLAAWVERIDPNFLARLEVDELRELLLQAPISERSRRVVLGRFFDEIEDVQLAQVESELSGDTVLFSHVQVTRAKNLAKLRLWQPLREYFWKNSEVD